MNTTRPSEAALRAAERILSGVDCGAVRYHGPRDDGQWCWQYRSASQIANLIDAELSPERDAPCPCTIADTPCQPRCTCVIGGSSSGCLCCSRYGSAEQRKASANRIVHLLSAPPTERDALIAVARAAKASMDNDYRKHDAPTIEAIAALPKGIL